MPAAIAAFALIAIIGAALAILASRSGSARLVVASPFGPERLRLVTPRPGLVRPWLRLVTPRLRIVTPPPPLLAPSARVFTVDRNGSSVVLRPIGLLLLVVGIGGIILSMLYWSRWTNPRHWPRRRTPIDGGPGDRGYD